MDQGDDVHGAHIFSAQPSKLGTHLGIYVGLYFCPISLQLKSGPEPHPEDADGSVALVGRPWEKNATIPGT